MRFSTLGIRLAAFMALCCTAGFAWGSISVSPSAIDLGYSGMVTLTASVSNGASATIDVIFDSDQDGSIDANEIGWKHYDVKDGQILPPTGAELVTDTDGLANGTIHVNLFNMATDERIVGHFVVRVKSGSSTNTTSFVINTPSASQSIAGQLRLNGTGKPGAAMLINTTTGEPSYICLTDASGNYTIPVQSAGTYTVTGVILNEASDMQNTAASVTLTSGQKKTGVNINIPTNPYRLKGQILRADNSQPIPYTWVDMKVESTGVRGTIVADGSGNYDFGISNGLWEMELQGAGKAGYMGGHFSNSQTTGTVSGASITGATIYATPIAAFVTAKARNAKTLAALPGALLIASPPGSYDWAASAYFDANGNVALGLSAGQWELRPQIEENSDLSQTILYPRTGYTKTIVAGAAAQSLGNIDFMPADGSITVKIVDENNHPLPGARVAGGGYGGTNNNYQGADLTADANGNAKLLTRNNSYWAAFMMMDGISSPPPPAIPLDVLARDGNVITIYPMGYRHRPYYVYGGNSVPLSLGGDVPQNFGFTYLGRATSTATFKGSYMYYAVVAFNGEVYLDAILGSDGGWYAPVMTLSTQNEENIGGRQDRKYATVGDNANTPALGMVLVGPRHLNGITVIHPDDHFNAIGRWGLYDAGK